MLINCGHQCVTGDYSWDGMRRGRHDMVIWQYTLAGMGRLRFPRRCGWRGNAVGGAV